MYLVIARDNSQEFGPFPTEAAALDYARKHLEWRGFKVVKMFNTADFPTLTAQEMLS